MWKPFTVLTFQYMSESIQQSKHGTQYHEYLKIAFAS